MSQGYENHILSNSEAHVTLRDHFHSIKQLFLDGSLTSQTLDEFQSVLTSLVDTNASMVETVNDNCSQREGLPKFN